MLAYLEDVIDYLKENMSDPVPQYILKKEILRSPSTENEYSRLKESKWYQQLVAEQWENGSWGRFHTQDTKLKVKRKFVTSEAALRRARELSLDKTDEMVEKAVHLMERYILGQEEWLDTNEHFPGFQITLRSIIAANLSLFDPRHPLVQERKRICAENMSKAMRNGSLQEEIWQQENEKSNEIYLKPFTLYIAWLLQNNDFLDKETERCYLDYIWNRKDGIYYCCDGLLSGIEYLESKKFLTWLSGLENLSNFSLFPEYMSRGATDHLLNEIRRLMNGEVTLPYTGPVFGHYSESWSNRKLRKYDLVLRILRVLVKC